MLAAFPLSKAFSQQPVGDSTALPTPPALKRGEKREAGPPQERGEEAKRQAVRPLKTDSAQADSTRPQKERLEAMVQYSAADSIDYDLELGRTYLVNKASITYKSMKLKAGQITIDWKRDMVYARGIKDSTGSVVQKPVMTQGGKTIKVDSIAYNIKTKRAVIQNIQTEEQQGIIHGKHVKRLSDSLYYIKDGRYTTDKDPKPDYYIRAGRIKYVTDKELITGPAQMYIHDVPTPLLLPFSYIPTSKSRRSGLIIPSWGDDNGIFSLRGLGYYFALSDYIDLKALFDIYTNGTYRAQLSSNYALRYRFNGQFSLRYGSQIQGTRGLSDYAKSILYEFTWNHSQDQKANPNLTLSANVRITNSKFLKDPYTLNNIQNQDRLVNQTSSYITLSKSFDQLPIQLTLNATHSLNTNTKVVQMELPKLGINLKRSLQPFAPKVGPSKGLLDNLNIGYGFDLTNRISTQDSLFLRKAMFDSTQTGAQHRITMGTKTTLLKHLNWTFNGNYNENWGIETTEHFYNPQSKQEETRKKRSFAAFRTFSLSTGLQTKLYGIKQFKDGSFIKAIRHTITPVVGFSYRPDFWSDFWGYTRFYRQGNGQRKAYSPFEDFLYGAPPRGMSSNINFSLDNNIEAKIKSKDDSGKYQKIKILEQLNFSTSYNLASDSFRLAPIAATGNTTLFQDKLNLNFNASFSPYKVEGHKKVDQLTTPWLKNFNLMLGYPLNNDTFSRKNREAAKRAKEEAEKAADKEKAAGEGEGGKKPKKTSDKGIFTYDEEGYAHYKIPWNLSLSYNFNYTSNRDTEGDTRNTNTLSFSGNIAFSPYWKVGFRSGYDFTATQFVPATLNFTRQLRSFVMTFNWVPFGPNKSYQFHIGIKADILKDVKYDRSTFPERNSPSF